MEETTITEFHTIFTTNHHVALKSLGTEFLFQSETKSYFKVGQIQQLFISKWDRCYFKVGQRQLFQSGSLFMSKWGKIKFESGQLLPSGEKYFFKVGQLFQSGKIISKKSIKLQSYDLEKLKTWLTFEINDMLKDNNEGSLIPQNIFEQLDLYLNIQAMKDNVSDATIKEIKSNKEL